MGLHSTDDIQPGDPDDAWMLEAAENTDSNDTENDSDFEVLSDGEGDESDSTTATVGEPSSPECDTDKEATVVTSAVAMLADSNQTPGKREALVMKKMYPLGPEGQKPIPLVDPFRTCKVDLLSKILWLPPGTPKQRGHFFTAAIAGSMIEFTEVKPKQVSDILKDHLDVRKRKDLQSAVKSFFGSPGVTVPEDCFYTIFGRPAAKKTADPAPAEAEKPPVKPAVVDIVSPAEVTPAPANPAPNPPLREKPRAKRRLNFDDEPKPSVQKVKREEKIEKEVATLVAAQEAETTNAAGPKVNSVKLVFEFDPASLGKLPDFLSNMGTKGPL